MNADNEMEGIRDPGEKALAGLFQMATQHVEVWQETDLPSLWSHQLESALGVDMEELHPESRETLMETVASGKLPPTTYKELFVSEQPGVMLLRTVKDYAKKLQAEKELLPKEICLALYYGAIAAALVHCDTKISSLNAAAMTKAFTWAAAQPWMDKETSALFKAALEKVY